MTTVEQSPEIDLLGKTWQRSAPHDQFDWLRREAPVYWHPGRSGVLGSDPTSPPTCEL